jgi:hypothetical protein
MLHLGIAHGPPCIGCGDSARKQLRWRKAQDRDIYSLQEEVQSDGHKKQTIPYSAL